MTPCSQDGGKLCDGAGKCVACVVNEDCPSNSAAVCQMPVCEGGACTIGPAPQGTACDSVLDGVCDKNHGCTPGKYVFVSSMDFHADALQSASNADAMCGKIATAANLGGTWLSWTSDSMTPANMRFSPLLAQIKVYRLLDDTVLTSNLGGALANLSSVYSTPGISIDENKQSQMGVPVWTGTTANGSFSGTACEDWKVADAETKGTVGVSGKTDKTWTNADAAACDTTAHLYCFQK